ncbi:hypothetical protein JG688_00017479, partial [Phytophthora aleatoria]
FWFAYSGCLHCTAQYRRERTIGKNPKLGKLDLIAVCRAAAVCQLYGNGLVASTAEQVFVNDPVSSSIPPHQYRSVTQHEFPFRSWQQLFQAADVDAAALETNLTQSRQHFKIIRKLLFKNATALQRSEVNSADFMHSL